MSAEVCLGLLCWVPATKTDYVKIFGFAEFLAALALLAVLFTISDIRSKFRTSIVPGGLYSATFVAMLMVGVQALATEVWIAQGWYVPKVAGLSSTTWQALFGLIFLGTFATWMYFAFIRPPRFGRRNAERYATTVYVMLVKANDDELKVLASEVGRSAQSIVRSACPDIDSSRAGRMAATRKPPTDDDGYAIDVLRLIASRKFCRHIVESSPLTLINFLDTVHEEGRTSAPVGEFARSVSIEALANKNSFVFHEDRRYDPGLIGDLKPVTQALYGRYSLIEPMARVGASPFDIPYETLQEWDGPQWEAYCRLGLVFFEDFARVTGGRDRSEALRGLLDNVSLEHAYGTYEGEQYYRLDEYRRLWAAVRFVGRAIDLLDEYGAPADEPRPRESYIRNTIYDDLAHLMLDACHHAARVRRKDFASWSIQHNAVWGQFFQFKESATWRIVRKRLCHLIAEQVCEVATHPNFSNVALLGFCANVMGLNCEKGGRRNRDRNTRALHRLVLWLIRKHYSRLLAESSRLADALLVGKLSFDSKSLSIVKTYEMGLSDVPSTDSLAIHSAIAPSPAQVRRLRKTRKY